MAHRGLPEHGPWWRAGRDLFLMAVMAGVFTVVFILGDLVLYGKVNW